MSDGLPLSGLIVYTAATDPNHLLGRPTGYTSKCAWVDSRVPTSDTAYVSSADIGFGGGIEVFRSASGGTARAKYLFTIDKALPLLGGWCESRCGGVS